MDSVQPVVAQGRRATTNSWPDPDLFLQHGFELTTLDAITAGMNITKGTTHGLYPNKEALFLASLSTRSRQTASPWKSWRRATPAS